MARVTVEDCERVVPNRFDLVILAAQRTRQIIAGEPITIPDNQEKKPVIALREIAAKTVSVESLKEEAIQSFCSVVQSADVEDDLDEIVEEDTYNPYGPGEMVAISHSTPSQVTLKEDGSEDSQDDAEEASTK